MPPTAGQRRSTQDNPWLRRRVIAFAHQGGSFELPSSTLAAMEHALEVGATALELDLHATADGELVTCHDPTVDRTTNGRGRIADLTLAEVQALDAAHWFVPGAGVDHGRPPGEYPLRGRGPEDHDYRIPTLREVLERFPGVLLNLDIKSTAPVVEAYEGTLAELLREHGRRDDVIVASFLDSSSEIFQRCYPEVAISAGTATTAEIWRAVRDGRPLPEVAAVALQVPEAYGDVHLVDERMVDAAHRHGLAVHVWTVNDPDDVRRLLALGVDGLISDVPTTLARVLEEEGLSWVPDWVPG